MFTAKNQEFLNRLRVIFEKSNVRFASSISVYEVYKLTLAREDKHIADTRVNTIKNQFTIVDVDSEIAEEGAKISHRLRDPMADALIMATAKQLRVSCVTDDPHFTDVKRVWAK